MAKPRNILKFVCPKCGHTFKRDKREYGFRLFATKGGGYRSLCGVTGEIVVCKEVKRG